MEKSPIESSDPPKEQSPAEIVRDIENSVPHYEDLATMPRGKNALTTKEKVIAMGVAAALVGTLGSILYFTAPGSQSEKKNGTPTPNVRKE